MALASKEQFIERAVERLRGTPMWENIPADQLEMVAGRWWDACLEALGEGHYAALEQLIRELGERLAHRGMALEDYAQLLRVHRDTALGLGWVEEQVSMVDEAIDGVIRNLHGLAPGWEIPKGYSYCGTVSIAIPQEKAEGKQERRGKGRAKLKQKIRVRSAVPSLTFEEIRDTINVAATGLYFQSLRDYAPGMRLFIVYPYETKPGSINREYLAEVVRVDARPDSLRRGVAVRLLHSV